MPENEVSKAADVGGVPNPKTGSNDAARGLGGHSKDASHRPGAPAEHVDNDAPVKPKT